MFNSKYISQRADDMTYEKWFHMKELYFGETYAY